MLSTRERPKLMLGPDGTPTHLVNGVCPAASCAPRPCVMCKEGGSAFPDFTLVAPLVGE